MRLGVLMVDAGRSGGDCNVLSSVVVVVVLSAGTTDEKSLGGE